MRPNHCVKEFCQFERMGAAAATAAKNYICWRSTRLGDSSACHAAKKADFVSGASTDRHCRERHRHLPILLHCVSAHFQHLRPARVCSAPSLSLCTHPLGYRHDDDSSVLHTTSRQPARSLPCAHAQGNGASTRQDGGRLTANTSPRPGTALKKTPPDSPCDASPVAI